MSGGGIPVTVVSSGGAPMTPVGLEASQVLADGDQSVQDALDARGRVLAQSGAAVTLSSTSEQSMVQIPIPAGTLGANGQIRVSAQFRRTTGSGEVDARLRFGAAGTAGDLVLSIEPATDGTIQLEAMIAARNSNTSQVTSLPLGTQSAGSAPVATTKNMAAQQYISICGRTPGSASDVLELQRYQVVIFPHD